MLAEDSCNPRLPLGLKIAAIYLILLAVAGLILPLTSLVPHHPEFIAKTIFYKQGAYSKEIILDILFFISGVGLFFRKSWARRMALITITISTIYAANSFAWGFAKGKPSITVLSISFIIVGLWNSIWFFLIARKKSATALSKEERGASRDVEEDIVD